MIRRFAKRGVIVLALAVGSIVVTSAVALADQPTGPATGEDGQFLCPAAGHGVLNATANNSKNGNTNGVSGGELGDGATFLPGNNQAGANVPDQALNTQNPGDSPGPGDGNSYWSPLWPGNALAE